jgi:diaminohydroxyphosphoribosylaminopyrimidine deaminase/5-amino-6-(5-phosphoribosylamino)uracil reductase
MKLALRLAKKGEGRTSPNPMVGAVIVRDRQIISTGYHKIFGGEHAEIMALKKAGFKAEGCTMYISLEPCCHYSKTGPCVDSLIKSGIKRIFIPIQDPNPLVNGRGIEKLQKHGIEIFCGLMKKEAAELNAPFIKFMTLNMPFVTAKIAFTLDGKIADHKGRSRWISSEKSRILVHRIRAVSDGILVGIGTVLKDDPLLLPVLVKKPQRIPKRIVLDPELKISEKSGIVRSVNQGDVIIVTSLNASRKKEKALNNLGLKILRVKNADDDQIDLKETLKELAKYEIMNLLLEGGSKIFSSFLREHLVDRFIAVVSPKIIGDSSAIPLAGIEGMRDLDSSYKFKKIWSKNSDDDVIMMLIPLN